MELIPHRLFGNLRVIVVQDVSWFCGKDVATALAYARPQNAMKRHVSENLKCIYETLREALSMVPVSAHLSDLHPHTVFVIEAGVSSLVMGGHLPAAVAFKDWVCEEVLPTLRKYGSYTMWREVKNERELHFELCNFARVADPHVRISPGLGRTRTPARNAWTHIARDIREASQMSSFISVRGTSAGSPSS